MSDYIIKCDDDNISISYDTLKTFMTKLTSDYFSKKHINKKEKTVTVTVSRETFEHIKQYKNIIDPEFYDYHDIKNTSEYLCEDTHTSVLKYLDNVKLCEKNIMIYIISIFDDDKVYFNFMEKCRKYDLKPLEYYSFSELIKYFVANDDIVKLEKILYRNNLEDTNIILQWILYYNGYIVTIICEYLKKIINHKNFYQNYIEDYLGSYGKKIIIDNDEYILDTSYTDKCYNDYYYYYKNADRRMTISYNSHKNHISSIYVNDNDNNDDDIYRIEDVLCVFGVANVLRDSNNILHTFSITDK